MLLAGYTGLLWRYGDIMIVQVLTLFVYFAFGASAYLLRDRIPMSLSIAALAAAAFLATLTTRVFVPVAIPCIAYLTLFAAMRLPLRGFDRRLDLSYGLYIYAFPVQQLLVMYGISAFGFTPYFVSALVIAGAFSRRELVHDREAKSIAETSHSSRSAVRGRQGIYLATLTVTPPIGRSKLPCRVLYGLPAGYLHITASSFPASVSVTYRP